MPEISRRLPQIAIYPGSFDPLTYGHLNIIHRGVELFPRLIVAVAENTSKKPMFSTAERVEMIGRCVGTMEGVEVDTFSGLLVEYARAKNARVILRGIRSFQDYEYEFQMALTNKFLYPELETVFLVTDGAYAHLSSTLIREIVLMGGSVRGMVPDPIAGWLEGKRKG
jgi:pantetheine-phosphate adenylyltransferase